LRKLTPLEKNWYRIEKLEELRGTFFMISNWMVLPLYLTFWLCDIIYAPELKWEFLAVRISVIPVCLIGRYYAKRISTFIAGECLALFFSFSIASGINCMIFMLHDPHTVYYAGLNLVAIGALAFIPFDRLFYFLAFALIFGPFYVVQFLRVETSEDYRKLAINSFFIFSTAVIAFVIRIFNENLRIKEYFSRVKLNDEIGNRDSIIIQKTDEGTRLNALSRQFSPQVVEGIKNRKIDIGTNIKRAQICAIFIDIVNSTEAVVSLEKEKVHETISAFMDDTVKILLKYDITIDKFLGDGILAFSNEPVMYNDYAERVVLAAFEIRQKVESRAEFYEMNWLTDLKIKVGIAVGYANVGFYGNEKYFRTYTAIGPVINLASRLCSAAHPNQILISQETEEILRNNDFEIMKLGEFDLKGFNMTQAFEIRPHPTHLKLAHNEPDCTQCNQGIMKIDIDENGIYQLKCYTCGYVKTDENHQQMIRKVS
jgi:adenylate cyclase